MKQPDFKRKAMGMIMVPLALGTLPLTAATLDVNRYYNGYEEFYYGSDTEGNTLIFYKPNSMDLCRFVGVQTSNTNVTIPESIRIRTSEDWEEEETYEEFAVNQFHINDDFDYIVSALGDAPSLTDITLPETITDVNYRQRWDHSPINIHFTSDNAPASINVEGMMTGFNGYLTSRCPISVPAASLESYKVAFNGMSCMVIPEGTDPKEAYEAEIAGLNALNIAYDPDCVPHASWSGTDDNGTLYAFEDDITFRGTITKEKSINIPETVLLTDPDWYAFDTYTVSRFCIDYYNEDDNGFPGSENLTDIYVPSHLTYAEFHGEGFRANMKFHFTSENVPEFRFYDGSGNYVNIYVPDEMFTAYADALGDQDYTLWPETPATPVTVNVATPGTLADQISSMIENLSEVRWLIVTGNPNEIDLRMIRRLPRLEKLDLSAATDLTTMLGCNGLKYLTEVKLPESITEIGTEAFRNCRNLTDINLPASVKSIGSYAFANTGIREMNLANVERFSNHAFQQSRIHDVDLTSAEVLGDAVFEFTHLGSVKFGNKLSGIPSYTFSDAHLTGTLEIPSSVTNIGYEAFSHNRDLSKIIIPKNVENFGGWIFYDCNPKTVECHMLFPYNSNVFEHSDVSNCTLYVPALTINEYLLADSWIDFTVIEALPDDLTVLDIDRDYTIKSDKGIADKANLNLIASGYESDKWGHLTVNRSKDLNLGDVTISARYDGEYYDPNYGWRYGEYYIGATLIPESTVTAQNIDVNLRLRTDRWTFLTFPFDVNVKDIVVDEDALWVVRKYDGDARAKLEENTWKNMTDETVLKAGEGYIFNCAAENRSEVYFTIRPAADGNAIFAKDAVEKTLAAYPSEFPHNASWNLAGNTFPAYLNLKGVEFDAPITIWKDGSYYAYSTIDDELVLDPFQAFFVQAQEENDVITLNPAARAHSREAAAALEFVPLMARAPQVAANRALFNINVKGENGADRTRVVVNELASAAYESNRDASKFMSSDDLVPQIFVNNAGVRMAINEAPLGNGEFILGARFGKKGEYTISLDTRNADDFSAMLIDNVTGEVTDLSVADYVFEADAALNNSRFTLALTSTNAVDAAVAEGLLINVEGNLLSIRADEAVEISVAAIDGKTVASALSADFSAELESGIYIVKAAQKTVKVKVGK